MSDLGEEIRSIFFGLMADTHTALPAKIESYDENELRAEVELLVRDESGESRIIVDAPVMTLRANGVAVIPPYSQGDPVLLVFAESSLEGPLFDGTPRDNDFERRHSLDDAVVVGGLTTDQETVSVGGSSDAFRIGDESGNGYLEIDNSGDVTVESGNVTVKSSNVTLGSGSAEALLKESGVTTLAGHTHPGDSGGTTGPMNETISGDVTQDTTAS